MLPRKVMNSMMKKSKSSDITCDQVVSAAAKLRDGVDALRFGPAVPWVYNPLAYAWSAHEQYLRKYVRSTCRVLFLGMNPGPWGMAQTGVPFGEVSAVKEWLKIDAEVTKPAKEHPKRPIEGLNCSRSEVSDADYGDSSKHATKARATSSSITSSRTTAPWYSWSNQQRISRQINCPPHRASRWRSSATYTWQS